MRAHLVQFDIRWEDKAANRAHVREMLLAAPVEPEDLVVLPEMFDTGFSFRLERTVDENDETLAFVSRLAHDLRATVQGGRTLRGPDGRGRNAAPVVSPRGELLCEYLKVHPFSFGKEAEHFTGGERVMTYVWTRDAAGSGKGPTEDAFRVCPGICYDLRFPELFRRGMLAGAEVIALGANWPATRAYHWRSLLIARAIENQAYVLGVNRCGQDPHLTYSGGSIAVSPKGEVLGELGDSEGVLTVDLDPAALREWRATFPAWRDVRLIRSE